VHARNVRNVIVAVGHEGHELTRVGASNVGMIRRALFGTLPDKMLEDEGTSVAVVRGAWSLSGRARTRIARWLELAIPQLDRSERVALAARIEDGSTWNFDFMLLISLSTAIVALGLVTGSAAVVIGATLVAPLMLPLLDESLALVQRNRRLILDASSDPRRIASDRSGIRHGTAHGPPDRLGSTDGRTHRRAASTWRSDPPRSRRRVSLGRRRAGCVTMPGALLLWHASDCSTDATSTDGSPGSSTPDGKVCAACSHRCRSRVPHLRPPPLPDSRSATNEC